MQNWKRFFQKHILERGYDWVGFIPGKNRERLPRGS